MALTAQEAITRFKESEERTHTLVNDPDDVGFYETDTDPAQQVETYPHFIRRVTNTTDGLITQASEFADRAKAEADRAVIVVTQAVEQATVEATAQADRAEAAADRAEAIVDVGIAEVGKPGLMSPDGKTLVTDPVTGETSVIGGTGISPYSPLDIYTAGQYVSINGDLFYCLTDNGPGTDAGVQDPSVEIVDFEPGEDGGEMWTQVTLPVSSNWYGGVVVTQTGRIVALGNGSTICIYSDDNGITWTQVTLPVSRSWQGGIVITQTGRIVALGRGSTTCIYSDDNGITWTQVTLPVSGNWLGRIVVTQTGRIVALGRDSTICIYSDDNGITWTQVTLPVSGNWNGGVVVTQTGRIVALGNGSTICIYSDDNGITWTQVTLPVSGNWYSYIVVPQIGRIVALGDGSTTCIYSDDNGITWTQVILPVSGNWYGSIVVTQTGRIVALGNGSTTCIYSDTSDNFIIWSPYWERLDTTPIGASVTATSTIPPTRRVIKYDGSLLSREDYPELWAKVEALFNPVADSAWTVDKFSTGDGSTTFRIPKRNYSGTGSNEFLKAA